MLSHIYKYRLKTLLRDKENMFWIMVFPIILVTLFNVVFGNLNTDQIINEINIDVISDRMPPMLEDVQGTFNFHLQNEEDAVKRLEDDITQAYVEVADDMVLVVKNRGLTASVIKVFLDRYQQTSKTVLTLAQEKPEAMDLIVASVSDHQTYTRQEALFVSTPNIALVAYFALVGMTCLYGGFLGLRDAIDYQANLSDLAARISITPQKKMMQFFYSNLATSSLQIVMTFILLTYMIVVLKVDFGTKVVLVYFTTAIGSIMGVFLGTFVGTAFKSSESMKNTLITLISLFGAFLAGMMSLQVKYTVAQNMPWLARVNPVNVLADSYYALYYYTGYERYLQNIMTIAVFIVIFMIGTYMNIRRRSYASI